VVFSALFDAFHFRQQDMAADELAGVAPG